jgi:lysophospholipase L1-like esterase
MLWRKLGGAVAQAKDQFPPPSLLLIQLGSNDLTEIKSVDLVNNITSDMLRIKYNGSDTSYKLTRSSPLVVYRDSQSRI